jgi:hypothetical protein
VDNQGIASIAKIAKNCRSTATRHWSDTVKFFWKFLPVLAIPAILASYLAGGLGLSSTISCLAWHSAAGSMVAMPISSSFLA